MKGLDTTGPACGTKSIMSNSESLIPAGELGLFTDLYELTMLQGYLEAGLQAPASFSLFVRRLPEARDYLLACGIEPALSALEDVSFSAEAIDYLRSLDRFSDTFLEWLATFRFEGDAYAVKEGTPVFSNEPLLEIVAPLPQAQLIETLLMNIVHHQTLMATKAARVVDAAQGRPVIDFGGRRMHGASAAVDAPRAFHIAGVDATSNMLAAKRYGLPVAGTMAHSFIESFPTEHEAFASFVQSFPETVLLVDTYKTSNGVKSVIDLAKSLGDDFRVSAIRIDSGDLASHAFEARQQLDAAGLQSVGIILSGGLDEYTITALTAQNVPVTGFGVGTAMAVSDDAPALDLVYKMTAFDGRGRMKLSPEKPTYPGRKQVYREEQDGKSFGDIIARADEKLVGRPLLQKVMEGGRILPALERDLDALRDHAKAEQGLLAPELRALAPADPPYSVSISPGLQAYTYAIEDEARRAGRPKSAGRKPKRKSAV